jgi:hypothetical protein
MNDPSNKKRCENDFRRFRPGKVYGQSPRQAPILEKNLEISVKFSQVFSFCFSHVKPEASQKFSFEKGHVF